MAGPSSRAEHEGRAFYFLDAHVNLALTGAPLPVLVAGTSVASPGIFRPSFSQPIQGQH